MDCDLSRYRAEMARIPALDEQDAQRAIKDMERAYSRSLGHAEAVAEAERIKAEHPTLNRAQRRALARKR